jgi:glycosyltransferase involved in cell wall biosynthesis
MWDTVHIIVGTLNARGGGELLALAFIKFFIEHRLVKKIVLYTKDEPNSLIISMFPPEFVRVLKHVMFRPLGILYSKKLWHGMPYIRAVQNVLTLNNSELLTINLNAESIPIPAQICYVDFPYFGISKDCSLRSKARKIVHSEALKLCKLILVNSSFTKDALCRVVPEVCERIYILYPPIPVKPMNEDTFLSNLNRRRNIVLTVSRFSQEKKLEIVLNIAKIVKECKFIIVGSLVDKDYYAYLNHIIEKECISNVKLWPNASFEELHSLRLQSKVYLHARLYEPFGVSIVEAMALGCVPVVHRSGGPWYDILERREIYGYAYSSVTEAVTKIKILLNDPNQYIEKALLALRRSKAFTYEKFGKRLYKVLNLGMYF